MSHRLCLRTTPVRQRDWSYRLGLANVVWLQCIWIKFISTTYQFKKPKERWNWLWHYRTTKLWITRIGSNAYCTMERVIENPSNATLEEHNSEWLMIDYVHGRFPIGITCTLLNLWIYRNLINLLCIKIVQKRMCNHMTYVWSECWHPLQLPWISAAAAAAAETSLLTDCKWVVRSSTPIKKAICKGEHVLGTTFKWPSFTSTEFFMILMIMHWIKHTESGDFQLQMAFSPLVHVKCMPSTSCLNTRLIQRSI